MNKTNSDVKSTLAVIKKVTTIGQCLVSLCNRSLLWSGKRLQAAHSLKRCTVLSVVVGASVSLSAGSRAAVNDFRWPYQQETAVNYELEDIEAAYSAYKAARITETRAGGNGRYRVMGGVGDGSSVSEGIAYGMILTLLFDDQTEFDGLWLFAKDHFDAQDLMHWHVGDAGQLLGRGAATDGDVDMAIALVGACVKAEQNAWPSSTATIDYCEDAVKLINNIYDFEVDQPGAAPFSGIDNNVGNELMPGDQWLLAFNYPEGIINLSYFPPGFFTVFGKFTGKEAQWDAVNRRNYDVVNIVQDKPGNCSKLVPNWNTYEGDVQVVPWQTRNSGWWSYDAARFAWRIAVDSVWYGSDDAVETSNELGSFFASVGMNNLWGEYSLDGQRAGDNTWSFFIANAASAIYGAKTLTPVNCGDATPTLKSDAQDAYDRLVNDGGNPGDYYGPYWRLVSMLLMTGNFPNFYEMAEALVGDDENNQDNNHQDTDFDPTLEVSTSLLMGEAPLVVSGLAQVSNDPDNQLNRVLWDFGDGQVGNGMSVDHRYEVPGDYRLEVTAIFSSGERLTETRKVLVEQPALISESDCQYRVTNEWSAGFSAEIVIKNHGNQAIDGWQVSWEYSDGSYRQSGWNARVSGSNPYVATDMGWNGRILPGEEVIFGVQGTKGRPNMPAEIPVIRGDICGS